MMKLHKKKGDLPKVAKQAGQSTAKRHPSSLLKCKAMQVKSCSTVGLFHRGNLCVRELMKVLTLRVSLPDLPTYPKAP